MLFFSSGGKAFRVKVWKLPEAGPTAKGRALVNLLPELGADTITTVLPLPQDETLWESLHLVFATASGNVRRNRLSDFKNVRAAGPDRDEAGRGRPPDRRRHLPRGRRRAAGDPQGPVHSLPVVRRAGAGFRRPGQLRRARHQAAERRRGHQPVGAAPCSGLAGRADRLPKLAANAKRRGNGEREAEAPAEPDAEDDVARGDPVAERFAEMEAAEEMLLTVTDMGFGKRTSAYEYRVTGRGGQGIGNITLAPRNGKAVVATFPVRQGDDIMMVTDAGRLIRVPVDQVRTTGRQAMGVTLFRVDKGEHVTSVFTVLEDEAKKTVAAEAGVRKARSITVQAGHRQRAYSRGRNDG